MKKTGVFRCKLKIVNKETLRNLTPVALLISKGGDPPPGAVADPITSGPYSGTWSNCPACPADIQG